MKRFSGWVGTCLFLMVLLGITLPVWSGEPPQRAISQVPSITEILFALGQQDRVVGVSRFCQFPPEAKDKPKVGGLHDADLERILTLNPDWIALFGGQSKIGDVLQSRGCHVYYCSVETTPEMFESIRYLGEVFAVPEKAEALVSSISAEIEDLRGKLKDLPHKRALYVVGREPGSLKQLYAAGPGTFLSEILNVIGTENCLQSTLGRYPVLSREALIVANPEVILDGGITQSEYAEGNIPPEWSVLASVSAVKEKRIIPVDDPHLTIPGPGITGSIRKLAILIHGDEARQRLTITPEK